MKTGADDMTLHLVRMAGITMLLVLCMLYSFLPGDYDALAAALSTMAQLFGSIAACSYRSPVGGI